MGSSVYRSLFAVLALGISLNLWAQDVEPAQDAVSAERQARIAELRELLQAERQARRQAIEARLANLSEDERAALQERRRMARQSQMRRAAARRGQRQPCDCNEAADGDSSN